MKKILYAKKITALVLSITLLISLCPNVIFAQDSNEKLFNYSVEASNKTPQAGESFNITASITDYTSDKVGIRGVQVDITDIDTDIFEIDEDSLVSYINDSTATSNTVTKQKDDETGKYFIRLAYAQFTSGKEMPRSTNTLMKPNLKVKEGVTVAGKATLPVTIVTNTVDSQSIEEESSVEINYNNGVDSIDVTSQPTKQTYLIGEDLETTGLVVTATYKDGTTSDVTKDVTLTGFDSTTAGTKTITVTYQGKTDTFTVTVKEPDLTGIEVTKEPDKTEYFVNETFNETGLEVTATYEDQSTKDVTKDVILTGFDSSTAGTKTITATYQGKTDTFEVTVKVPALTEIEVTKEPDKTIYVVGDEFNKTGLEVTATYEDQSTKDVTNDVVLTGFDSTTAGTKTITVTYQDKTDTFEVTVKEPELTNIAVTKQPVKTQYFVGDEFDANGMEVTATYENGKTEDVTKDVTLTGFDSTTAGTKTITVTYQGKTDTFTVAVKEPVLVELIIKSEPTKKKYMQNVELDTTGISLSAKYENEKEIDVNIDDCTISGFNKTVAGVQNVIITYQTVSDSYKVSVADSEFTKDMVKYAVVAYDDSTQSVKAVSGDANIKSANLSAPITSANGIEYTAITEIVANAFKNCTKLEEILIGSTIGTVGDSAFENCTALSKVVFEENNTAVRNDLLTLGNNAFKGCSNLKAITIPDTVTSIGTDALGVDANGNVIEGFEIYGSSDTTKSYAESKGITYTDITQITAIKITQKPDKTTYNVGDDFDSTGMVLTATMSDTSTENITNADWTTDFDSSTVGTKIVTVTFAGFTDTFTVTIKKDDPTPPTPTEDYIIKASATEGGKITPNGYIDVDAGSSKTFVAKAEEGYTFTKFIVDGEKVVSTDSIYIFTNIQCNHTIKAVFEKNSEISKIEVTSMPTKVEYKIGEKLDTTGLVITATYSDGTTAEVTGYTLSELDSTTAGEKTITVTYAGKTTSFKVTVKGDEPTPVKNGWINENGQWKYYKDGIALTGWQNSIPGWNNWFYFDANGVMQTGWQGNLPGWAGQWFYFNSNGTMATGWKNDIPGWNSWFYFNANGTMATGWKNDIPGWSGWFYFNTNGTMATGWIKLDAWYYLAENGVMLADTRTPDGYYVDENGRWS